MAALPRSVLTAIDFGDASGRATALGGFVARSCGATLRLLHAESIEAPLYFTSEQLDALEGQRRATRTQAEQFASRFGRQHTSVAFSTHLDDGPPVDAILRESETADLVVMGTHGRHGPRRWWLGSVAERVLREIAGPLLIVHAGATNAVDSLFARVLVHAIQPLNGEVALEYARNLAALRGGAVFDERHSPLEPLVKRFDPTLLVAAAPEPRTPAWLSSYGDRLVRSCQVPILFVPEVS